MNTLHQDNIYLYIYLQYMVACTTQYLFNHSCAYCGHIVILADVVIKHMVFILFARLKAKDLNTPGQFDTGFGTHLVGVFCPISRDSTIVQCWNF
jgi:hypothetical protein